MDLSWVDEIIAAWGAPHHARRVPVRVGNEWARAWIWPHTEGHVRIVEARLSFGQRIEARGPNGRAEYVAPLGRVELSDSEVRAVLLLAGLPVFPPGVQSYARRHADEIYCGKLRTPPSGRPGGRMVVQVCTRSPHAPEQPHHWRTIDGSTSEERKAEEDLTRQGLVTNV